MSSGFFARHRKESHNRLMTDRHTQKLSYPLRMPDELRERIAAEAKKNNRSINAEIVSVLQWHYASTDVTGRAMRSDSDEKMIAFMQELRNAMMPHMTDLILKHGILEDIAKQTLERDSKDGKP